MKTIKELYQKFSIYITYLISSGISFVLDLVLYTIFILFLENRVAKAIIISSYLARAISSFINYLINKHKVFKYDKKENSSMYKYFLLVIINITVSSILVTKLVEVIPVYSTIIKAVVDGLIFIANFFIQKIFIFNSDKKENKLSKFLVPLLCFITLFIHIDKRGIIFDYKIYEYISMIILLPLLYILFLKVFKKENNKALNILSIIFSSLMVLGYSYSKVGTAELLISSEINILINIIKFLGYYILIKNILNYLYDLFLNYKFKNKENRITKLFNKHPFLFSFLTILIIYSIYLIAFYPGIINYDNANQIKEVMGMHTRYLDSIIVLDKNITLTNFNPIIHTLLLGNLFKLGNTIGNVNFGMFLYTLIQMLIVVLTLAYSVYFLYKEKVKTNYLLLILLIYVIIPFFPFYAITAVKDTLFTMAVLLYIIKLYQFIKYKNNIKDNILFIIIMILVILLRNNGIYLILLSFPFTLFIKKKERLRIAIIIVAIMIFYVGYNKTLTYLNIPNTSIREALSVPFQQTARYVKYYDSDVTKEEKEKIDKILNYETLGSRYQPELSDKVKNEFNKYTTDEELKEYFIVWSKMLIKKPMTYINATVNNIYGYFYPNTYKWYLYTTLNRKLPEAGFDYHFNDLKIMRTILSGYGNGFKYLPVLKLTVNCGFYTWIYIFLLVLLCKKKKEYTIILLPMFALLLTTIAGPANTYFRYVLPYAITLPVIIGMILREVNKSHTKAV